MFDSMPMNVNDEATNQKRKKETSKYSLKK